MQELLNSPGIRVWLGTARAWVEANLVGTNSLIQLAVIIGLVLAARALTPRVRQGLGRWRPGEHLATVHAIVTELSFPMMAAALLWLAVMVASDLELRQQIIKTCASLVSAWVVIRALARVLHGSAWVKPVASLVWIIAAMNILDLLVPTVAILDSVSITLGTVRISPYTVIRSTLALTLLLSVALWATRMLETRINTSDTLSPSLKVLIGKSLKIVLLTLAAIVAIQSVGIDLGALTIFSGAIGLGVGFGLQRIIANLVSGLILLADKSIKPGDVVGVQDTYGWVNTLGARYVSVVTRDGVEHLIPNENLITERVENWTYSNSRKRLKIPVGVHYDSDVRKAIQLCKEAALETDRILDDPAPSCLLRGFGDSSVDLEARFWIEDPRKGVSNVTSEVLLRIWDKFQANGIEIPYPQRDLHLRTPPSLVKGLSSVPG